MLDFFCEWASRNEEQNTSDYYTYFCSGIRNNNSYLAQCYSATEILQLHFYNSFVLSFETFVFSNGKGAFVIGLRHISAFFSLYL